MDGGGKGGGRELETVGGVGGGHCVGDTTSRDTEREREIDSG